MKIAIIDDERPARSELIHQLGQLVPDAQFLEADSGASALELVSRESFDLIFMDINLGDLNGTTLAMAVKQILPQASIVFVTAFSEYAIKAFEIGVSNYVLKPFSVDQLDKVIQKCQQEQADRRARSTQKMAIANNRKVTMMDLDKIIFIETDNRGTIVHTTEGDFKDTITIGEYERRLNDPRFFRGHKCYIINLDMVHEVIPWHNNCVALTLHHHETSPIPVGRNNTRELKARLGI